MSRASGRVAVGVSAVAAVLAAAALVVALDARRSAYDRVVGEVWEPVEPGYREFGLQVPARRPGTLREALGPLLALVEPLAVGGEAGDPGAAGADRPD